MPLGPSLFSEKKTASSRWVVDTEKTCLLGSSHSNLNTLDSALMYINTVYNNI